MRYEGVKGWRGGWYVIEVNGFERMIYQHSPRDSEARYRRQFYLVGKHIKWR